MTYPFYINAVNDFIDQKRMEEVQRKNREQNIEQVRKGKERMKQRNEELKKTDWSLKHRLLQTAMNGKS